MGSIGIREVRDVDEVVMVGDHPKLKLQVVVIGTTGGDDVWNAACSLAEIITHEGEMTLGGKVGVVIVDNCNAQVRMGLGVARR